MMNFIQMSVSHNVYEGELGSREETSSFTSSCAICSFELEQSVSFGQNVTISFYFRLVI